MKKISLFALCLFVVACTCKNTNPTDGAAAPSLPEGQLVSMDDPASSIEFRDGKFIESYDGKLLGTYAYVFDPACANCSAAFPEGADAGAQGHGCFSYTDAGESFCFIIVDKSADAIEYSMLGGRGNTLRYKRPVARYQTGDLLTVLAKSGVVLRQQPDIASEKIASFVYGQQVTVSGAPGAAFQVEAFPGFSIKGHWVQVSSGDKTGYMFDGFLSKLQAPKESPFETLMAGAKSTGKTSSNPSEKDKNTGMWLKEVETFSNGVRLEMQAYEGGSTSLDRYPSRLVSLTEAYLLLYALQTEKGSWSYDAEHRSIRFDSADELSATILREEGGDVVVEVQVAD